MHQLSTNVCLEYTIVNRGNGYETRQSSLLYVFVLFFGLDPAQNTIVVYSVLTGKNNRFPFLDILGNLKNTHKNPKFGRMRQVPIRELGWEFPGWDLSHFAKFGIFMGIL